MTYWERIEANTFVMAVGCACTAIAMAMCAYGVWCIFKVLRNFDNAMMNAQLKFEYKEMVKTARKNIRAVGSNATPYDLPIAHHKKIND